jgi:hypothetical protein
MKIFDIDNNESIGGITRCLERRETYAIRVSRSRRGFDAIERMVTARIGGTSPRSKWRAIVDVWTAGGKFGLLSLGFADESYAASAERDPLALVVIFSPK